MRPTEREVAGLKCSEVMAELSRYLEGDLAPDRSAQIEAHVSECQACAAFGEGFGRMIEAVRTRLGEPEPVPADVAVRLRAALG
jgi:anti-sigma factor RsiW